MRELVVLLILAGGCYWMTQASSNGETAAPPRDLSRSLGVSREDVVRAGLERTYELRATKRAGEWSATDRASRSTLTVRERGGQVEQVRFSIVCPRNGLGHADGAQLAHTQRLAGMLLLRVVPEADMRWLPSVIHAFVNGDTRGREATFGRKRVRMGFADGDTLALEIDRAPQG